MLKFWWRENGGYYCQWVKGTWYYGAVQPRHGLHGAVPFMSRNPMVNIWTAQIWSSIKKKIQTVGWPRSMGVYIDATRKPLCLHALFETPLKIEKKKYRSNNNNKETEMNY